MTERYSSCARKGWKMRRLTEKDDQGNWARKGVSWDEFNRIQEPMRGLLYGALCKLRDYEETGLDPKQVEELAERQTSSKSGC